MQDYALLNTCCIFKYERFCNLQCLLHLNFWIYFLKNMVLHMKMCKSLHIAHFEYATLQYIVPHFGSLFCTLWIFQCAKSCTLQCNISKVPILTLYVILTRYDLPTKLLEQNSREPQHSTFNIYAFDIISIILSITDAHSGDTTHHTGRNELIFCIWLDGCCLKSMNLSYYLISTLVRGKN